MSEKAKERIQALGNQLSPPPSNSDGSSSTTASEDTLLPPVQKVAGKSAGPRLEGKVAIITGRWIGLFEAPCSLGRPRIGGCVPAMRSVYTELLYK